MDNYFSTKKFLKELKQTTFTLSPGNTYKTDKWEIISHNTNSNAYSIRFESKNLTFHLDITEFDIVSLTCHFVDGKQKKKFYDTIASIFEEINYDCLFIDNYRKPLPATTRAKKMFSWFEPFVSNATIHLGSNPLIFTIEHFRSDFRPVFNFEEECIDIFLGNEKIHTIKNLKEAKEIHDYWIDKSNVITNILSDALAYFKTFDAAAFEDKNSKGTFHLFNRQIHLGFSFYLKNNKIYYYATHRNHEMENFSKDLITDPEILKEVTFSYINDFIKRYRLKAVLEGARNNFFTQFYSEMIGFTTDVEDIFFANGLEEEVKKYVNTHFHELSLRKCNQIERIYLEKKLAKTGSDHTLLERVSDFFIYGEYVFVLGEDIYGDYIIYSAKKEAF